jgi:hypothetical protein
MTKRKPRRRANLAPIRYSLEEKDPEKVRRDRREADRNAALMRAPRRRGRLLLNNGEA